MIETKRKRRYPAGKEPIYDRIFTRHTINSQILSKRNGQPDIHSINISDKVSLNALQTEIEGDKNGMSNKKLASIPFLKSELFAIEKEFKNFNQTRINEGRAIIKQMPNNLHEKKVELEAIFDVRKLELNHIKKLLSNLSKQEAVVKNQRILKYGTRGSAKLRNGICSEIDGQKVSVLNDILIIDEPGSRYDGMRVSDYREFIVRVWSKATQKLIMKQQEKIDNSEMDGCNAKLNIQAPLPDFPAKCINYKKLKRTKNI